MFGTYPGADGAATADDHGVTRPLTEASLQRAHDLPHCYNCNVASINGGAMDGFNQTDFADQFAFTQFHKDQISAYWSWAKRYAIADHFFASAVGPSFPNHMYSIAATSGGALDNPWQPPPNLVDMQAAGLRQVLGVRHRARRIRRGDRSRGLHGQGVAVLRLQDRGRPPQREAHPLVLLRRHEFAARLHLVGVLRDRSLPQQRQPVVQAHPAGGRRGARHPGRPAAAGLVDHASVPAVPAPGVQLLLGAELDDRGDERPDALRRVEGHARRDDVGRLRRVLRPRAAGAAGRLRARHPGAGDDHQPVRALRATSTTRCTSSPACCASSRTTGPSRS